MAWRDTIQQASFRGIHFKVETAENEFSRNIVQHEFPLRETVLTEDLGRKISKYNLQGFVIGNDYNRDRDSLIKALQQPGTGTLIHPYLGSIEVVIESFTVKETFDEGRIARFTISALEAGDKLYPESVVDNPGLITAKSNILLKAGVIHFENIAVMTDVPDFVRAGATGTVGSFAGLLKTLIRAGGLVNAGINQALNRRQYFSNSTRLVNDLIGLASPDPAITTDALTFGQQVQSVIGQINLLTGNGREARKVLRSGRAVTSSPVTEYTPNEVLVNVNQDAAKELIKITTIAEEAKSLNQTSFVSRNDALAIRDDITAQLDLLMAETTDDDSFRAMSDLKTVLVGAIPAVDSDLPNVETISISNPTPSLVLSYDVYGNIQKESEILALNNIPHPGFIPIGNVEVLING